MCELDRPKRTFDFSLPKLDEIEEILMVWSPVVMLPGENIENVRVVRDAVIEIRSREAVASEHLFHV